VNTALIDILIAPPMYGINAPSCEYSVGVSKYIRITDITDEGRYLPDNQCYVSCANPEQYFLHENDIVIARTGASVGKSYLYNKNDGTLVFAGFLIKVSIDPKKVDTRYIFEYLHTKQYWDWIKAESARSGQPGINGKQYASFNLLLPSLPEQRAIAEVLSDAHAHIAALEKLIAKKRAVKRGAMQELLTGKRRLPGFGGEWVEKPLSDFGYCVRGVSYNPNSDLYPYEHRDSFVLLRANNIVDERIILQNVQFVQKNVVSDEQLLRNGDIAIAMSSGSAVAIGKSAIFNERSNHYCVGAFCAIFRSEQNRYIRFLFQSDLYRVMLSSVLEGTSINNLNGKIIGALTFLFPPSEKEQSAIASVLSDMDAEIDALGAKLDKARRIKRGMMSELLTGRIRLIELEVNSETAVSPKIVELPKKKLEGELTPIKGHNDYFEDAVILAVLADKIGSPDFPFTAFDAQKFPYLLRRHIEGVTRGYKKFAAGPYNPELKYKSALPIALNRNYVKQTKVPYLGVIASANIQKAKEYFHKWYGEEPLLWIEQFQFIKGRKNELELLTTVDMAMVELRADNMPITMLAVKNIIQTSKEWTSKLKREIFSDANIERAINWSNDLFGQEV